MIDVIYPFAPTSVNDDIEIHLSIGLLRKHCKDDINIIVAGQVNIDVDANKIIKTPKVAKSRFHSSAANLYAGLEASTGSFAVLMNDDFFALQDFSFEDMPMWHNGRILDVLDNEVFNKPYKKNISNSVAHVDDLNFAIHVPLPLRHVQGAKMVLKRIANTWYPVSFRNVYGNVFRNLFVIEERTDVKLKEAHSIVDIKGDWFSVNDSFLSPDNIIYIKKLYYNE